MLRRSLLGLIQALAVVLLVCSVTSSFAQQTTLRLPPSLERELKLRGANVKRVIRFVDTLKADKRIAQSLKDTAATELDSSTVHDSALVTIDSAVSLTDKEWLDSMLAELPETERTPEGIRFHYPDRMIITTSRKQVPFDSTITASMDPVSKEDLPLLAELPKPVPFSEEHPPRYTARAMIGSPYLPEVSASAMLISSEHTTIDLGGAFLESSPSLSAIRQVWELRGSGAFTFDREGLTPYEATPQLNMSVSVSSLSRSFEPVLTVSNAAITREKIDANVLAGELPAIQANVQAHIGFMSDNTTSALSESATLLAAELGHQADQDAPRFSFGFAYNNSGAGTSGFANPTSLSATTLNAAISSRLASLFDWKIGIGMIGASDEAATRTYVAPMLRLDKRFSNDLSLSFDLGRSAFVQSFDVLLAENPFYAHDSSLALVNGSHADPRRTAVEAYHVDLSGSYFLSAADELHFNITSRSIHSMEVFRLDTIAAQRLIIAYDPSSETVSELAASFGGSLLLFTNDRFGFSLRFASDISSVDNAQIPYSETLRAEATYRFGSLFEKFFPSVGFLSISRRDASFFYLNASAEYRFSATLSAFASLKNIFGSDGAFWAPFVEYPRTFEVGVGGAF